MKNKGKRGDGVCSVGAGVIVWIEGMASRSFGHTVANTEVSKFIKLILLLAVGSLDQILSLYLLLPGFSEVCGI